MIRVTLHNQNATEAFADLLAGLLTQGDVVCLDGDLGAGKTTFTRYLAKGLGVPADCLVSSPTFSIIHEYPGNIPVYHMDFYRLSTPEEVLELGIDEYFELPGITIIEWATRARDILPENRVEIRFSIADETQRQVEIVECGDKGNGIEKRVEEWGRNTL